MARFAGKPFGIMRKDRLGKFTVETRNHEQYVSHWDRYCRGFRPDEILLANAALRWAIIYDYVDIRVPVLARMAANAELATGQLAYTILGARDLFSGQVVTSSALATR